MQPVRAEAECKTTTETHRTEVTLEVTTEAAAAEQQVTAEEQQLREQQLLHEQQQQQRSGGPTARRWEAEDVRPVQAEPAEREHWRKRRWCQRQGGASRSRSSSACPHYMALAEAQSDGQRVCSKCACTQGQGQDTRSGQRAQGGASRPRSCPHRASDTRRRGTSRRRRHVRDH